MADSLSVTTLCSEDAHPHHLPKAEPMPQPYQRLVSSMKRNHPNLSTLAEILAQPSEDGVAAVVNFHEDRVTEERFSHSSQLRNFLNRDSQCHRRLFLLQGLPSNYIEVLGPKFNIDPNFFARQIQSGILHSSKGVRDIPLLSSHPTSRESFCLRYHELREFFDPISDWELRVMDQARRVSVSKWNGEFDGVGIVRKNASVWFRPRKAERGWDAIILLDPPVGDKFYVGVENNTRPCTLKNQLYRGGYVDFCPPVQGDFDYDLVAHAGPQRNTALDDLIYYYTRSELASMTDFTSPTAVTGVLKRYVASHWTIQLQYSLDLLLKYENSYHRACFFASVSSTLIQNSLRDVQHLNDRVAGWCEQVDRSLNQFKASSTLGSFPGQIENDPQEDDFVHILHQLRELGQRVQTVITSMTGLVSIIETMRMKELSLLGMVFIPLALTSGLFSMEGEFAPGGSSFWVFWVVGLALVLVVFIVAFGINPWIVFIKSLEFKRHNDKKAARMRQQDLPTSRSCVSMPFRGCMPGLRNHKTAHTGMPPDKEAFPGH